MPMSSEVAKQKVELVAMASSNKYPQGGNGGSVEIIGGAGTAQGGNGGRGGALGHGWGGNGGGGKLVGSGNIRGGSGGDAGRPARPALGGASPLGDVSQLPAPFNLLPELTDIYGISQVGKGGDSYTEFVVYDGYRYCLNILLHLLQGPTTGLVSRPEVIDAVDELGAPIRIKNGQEWWDLAIKHFPKETFAVMEHVRICETE